MKTHPYSPLLAVALAAALASCAQNQQPTKMPVSASLREASPARAAKPDAAKLFREVNSYRSSIGASQLQRHAGLDNLAQAHCEYLAKRSGQFSIYGSYVSHMGFDGRTVLAREKYQMENLSENVAASNRTGDKAQNILTLWQKSKEHHKNMSDKWTHTGVGMVVGPDGMVYATQLFATVTMSQMARRERFNRF